MILSQLSLMNGNYVAIQRNRKPIATLLWVTLLGTVDESQCLYGTRHQLLGLWDQIHLVDPTLAVAYLDVLLYNIDVNGDRVTARPGSERVAGVASVYLLHTLSSSKPMVVEDIRRRYPGVIPFEANFEGTFRHTMVAIHALSFSSRERRPFKWLDYQPCAREEGSFATTLVRVAYGRKQHGKVPRWVLRFALHSISQDPPPQTSVVVYCLTIIAIDLDCDVSSIWSAAPDERCVCM